MKNIRDSRYNRIGIVAQANLDKDSLPPGLAKWMEHMTKPWNNQLIKADNLIVAKLSEEQTHRDQCHHDLNFEEELVDKVGLRFRLDWQRVFKKPPLLKYAGVLDDLDKSKNNAIEYFERFGEGDLNYE